MANVIPFPNIRSLDPEKRLANTPAWLQRAERWRTGSRFGDLGATQLQAILDEAARGNVWDWADLVEYMIGSDDHLVSLYATRTQRVVQADWIIVPSKFGDQDLAQQAASFIEHCIGQIDNWEDALQDLLHAVALGYAVNEMRWAFEKSQQMHFITHLEPLHAHRFRYDELWRLRLYDKGVRRGPEGYGELLDPRFYVAHFHREQSGYPGIGGVMRSCAWRWMFRRWVDKFWIQYMESHGSPFTYAKVAANTPKPVRDEILASLQSLSADHVAVIEQGGEIVIEAAAQAAKGDESHSKYMAYAEASLTKAWLGMADAVDPGAHGSQAAVSTRTSATMDPRMVVDGRRLANTIRRTVFTRLLWENRHLFQDAASVHDIPIPEMRFRTSGDEVKVDIADQAAENADASKAGEPTVSAPKPGGSTPKMRAQASPKARAPGRPGKSKTPPTTSGLGNPLEQALRGQSVEPEFSLESPHQKPLRF